MRQVVRHFGAIKPGDVVRRPQTREPEQLGERRVTVSREGTTAYLKIGYHAPSVNDPDFFPLLVLDAVLTGAKGVNLWASFRTPPPQRSARLYRALVNGGFASAVNGGLVPTQEPFLYTISVTATEGTSLAAVEEATLAQLDAVRRHGITEHELQKAKTSASCAARIRRRQHLEHRAPARIFRDRRELAAGALAGTAHRCGDAAPGSRGGSQLPQDDQSHDWLVRSATLAGRGCRACR